VVTLVSPLAAFSERAPILTGIRNVGIGLALACALKACVFLSRPSL